MEQEHLLILAVLRRHVVVDEEVERHVGVPGIVDREHPAVAALHIGGGTRRPEHRPEQGIDRRRAVGVGDIPGDVGVGRLGLRRIGIPVGKAGRGPHLVGTALPGGEGGGLGRLFLSQDRVPVLQYDRVVGDRRLMIETVVVRLVLVVVARVAREQGLVEDLEGTRIRVVVVRRRAVPDLHIDRGGVAVPRTVRDHLPEPAAVVEDQIQPVVARARRAGRALRFQDHVVGRGEIGVVREVRPAHCDRVVEQVRRDHRGQRHLLHRLFARSPLMVALGEDDGLRVVGDFLRGMRVRGTHHLLHIRRVIGELPGRGFEQPRAPEVGAEADGQVGRDALRIIARLVVFVADGDVLLVDPPGNVLVPGGFVVVDRDRKRKIVAQDLPFAPVPRDRALLGRREPDLHIGTALLFDADDELLFVGGGQEVIAPVVDLRRREHHLAVAAAGVAGVRDLEIGDELLHHPDRVVAVERDAGHLVQIRLRPDGLQDLFHVIFAVVPLGVSLGHARRIVVCRSDHGLQFLGVLDLAHRRLHVGERGRVEEQPRMLVALRAGGRRGVLRGRHRAVRRSAELAVGVAVDLGLAVVDLLRIGGVGVGGRRVVGIDRLSALGADPCLLRRLGRGRLGGEIGEAHRVRIGLRDGFGPLLIADRAGIEFQPGRGAVRFRDDLPAVPDVLTPGAVGHRRGRTDRGSALAVRLGRLALGQLRRVRGRVVRRRILRLDRRTRRQSEHKRRQREQYP